MARIAAKYELLVAIGKKSDFLLMPLEAPYLPRGGQIDFAYLGA
jgi:hypothetical protein